MDWKERWIGRKDGLEGWMVRKDEWIERMDGKKEGGMDE